MVSGLSVLAHSRPALRLRRIFPSLAAAPLGVGCRRGRRGDGFTQDHWAALKRHGTERVWIAYGRDEAGIETWRMLFPKGMDANEYARKVAPAEKSLGVLLQQAEWIGKGKRPMPAVVEAQARSIEQIAQRYNATACR